MVHKKSEYRLQFLQLSNDIRAKIWRENVLFRQTLKQRNLSDHYWRYQLMEDICDCEDAGDIACMDTDLKRKSNEVTTPHSFGSALSIFCDKGVQTSDWSRGNPGGSPLTEERTESLSNENQKFSLVNEPNLAHKSSASKIANTLPEVKTTLDPKIGMKKGHQNFGSSNLKTILSPVKGSVHSYLNRSPTRNALESFKVESKTAPVFAPFGWNDSDKNVGDQKTFNVRAPTDQVHQSALLASGKRLLELESYVAEQRTKRKQQNSRLSVGPINVSSIWMTEYQESFSKGQRAPLAKSTLSRPIVWRYI